MGNTLTLAYNKVQYMIAKNLSDPEADNYAKQQAAQAKQDAEAKKRKVEAAKNATEAEQQKKEEQEAALELQKRSQFSSVGDNVANILNGVLKVFSSLLLISLILYGGYISANKAIGYNIPFRLLSFLYGCIFFIFVIPKMFFDIYYNNIKYHHYAFLPLTTHVPSGNFENFFIGAFCYTENDTSRAAKEEVRQLYEKGFKNSLKAVADVVTAVGAVAGAVVAANSNDPTKPTNSSNKTSNDPKPLEASPAKPEAKPETKPAAPEAKPEAKPETKPAAPPAAPPAAKPAAPPAAKPAAPPAAKPAAPPAIKAPEAKPEDIQSTPGQTPGQTPPASPKIQAKEPSGSPQPPKPK